MNAVVVLSRARFALLLLPALILPPGSAADPLPPPDWSGHPENRCSADVIVSMRSSIVRTDLTSASVRRRKEFDNRGS